MFQNNRFANNPSLFVSILGGANARAVFVNAATLG